MLYQLSYSREAVRSLAPVPPRRNDPMTGFVFGRRGYGGEGDRTPDLVNAIHALSQLSYAPAILGAPEHAPERNTASYRGVARVSSDFRSTN